MSYNSFFSQKNIVDSVISNELIRRFESEYSKIIDFNKNYNPIAIKIRTQIELNNTSSEDIADSIAWLNSSIDRLLPVLEVSLGDDNFFLDNLIDRVNNTNLLNIDSMLIRSLGLGPGDSTSISNLIETPERFIRMNSTNILSGVFINASTIFDKFECKIGSLITAYAHNILYDNIANTFINITRIYETLLANYTDYIDEESLDYKIENLDQIKKDLYLDSSTYLFDINYMFTQIQEIVPLENDYISNISSVYMIYDLLLNNVNGQINNRCPNSEIPLIDLESLYNRLLFNE